MFPLKLREKKDVARDKKRKTINLTFPATCVCVCYLFHFRIWQGCRWSDLVLLYPSPLEVIVTPTTTLPWDHVRREREWTHTAQLVDSRILQFIFRFVIKFFGIYSRENFGEVRVFQMGNSVLLWYTTYFISTYLSSWLRWAIMVSFYCFVRNIGFLTFILYHSNNECLTAVLF